MYKSFEEIKEKNLNLDLSRGKPSSDILDLSNDLLKNSINDNLYDNIDIRNYSNLDGLPSAKKFFSSILDIPAENIFVGGNSSLFHMANLYNICYNFGINCVPWKEQEIKRNEKIKFLCPVPGYDRHFEISKLYGTTMINIPLNKDGPDINRIKELIENDDMIKGIWLVPKYQNPTGVVFSDEVLDELSKLNPKADDFKIFYDNAYGVHHVFTNYEIKNFYELSKNNNTLDRLFYFFSTSKITFPGAGVGVFATSSDNYKSVLDVVKKQTIGFDKVNQVRLLNFLKDKEGVEKHMGKIADILKTKFEICFKYLDELKELGLISYITPKGGYFISIDLISKSAKTVIKKCAELGVKLTPAGSTYPNMDDPNDSNIRLAPTYPNLDELKNCLDVLSFVIKNL